MTVDEWDEDGADRGRIGRLSAAARRLTAVRVIRVSATGAVRSEACTRPHADHAR
jgi:hypothetical protein